MNKMIAIVFDDERKAYEGLKALKELHADDSITLYSSAVIAKHPAGKVSVKQTGDPGAARSVSRSEQRPEPWAERSMISRSLVSAAIFWMRCRSTWCRARRQYSRRLMKNGSRRWTRAWRRSAESSFDARAMNSWMPKSSAKSKLIKLSLPN